MSIDFEFLTERQKKAVLARVGANHLGLHKPLAWITPPERYAIYDFVKAKFDIASGRIIESGWDIDTMPIVDFGNVNAAGALTIRGGFNTFPLTNPAHVIGSVDPEPFELSTITAINGDRQIGTSTAPIVLMLGAYCVHITGAGAVYNPTTTTLNIRVISASGATAGAFTTLATLNVSTATNFVDVVPITATTGRNVSITGTNLTNIAAIFNGDSVFGEAVMAGAANHQSNLFYSMLELA